MCAKNHLLVFSSFLDIWENVEWPRFFGPPCIHAYRHTHTELQAQIYTDGRRDAFAIAKTGHLHTKLC